MPITFSQLKEALKSNQQRFHILQLNSTHKLLVWEDCGRIFGPFTDENSVGISWISQDLSTPESCKQFLNSAKWNIGGDRLWIAPEFPFFVKQRTQFSESYTVQDTIDPGHYHFIDISPVKLVMSATLSAELYEHRYKAKTFTAERTIRPCKNPLHAASNYAGLMARVTYCGFTQDIELRDNSVMYPMELEIWNLFQVRAGGTFLIPFLGNNFEYVDYYTPSLHNVLEIGKNYAAIHVKSTAEHKIGIKSFQTFGRIAYLLPESDGTFTLLVRNYYNNPSDTYIKDPSDRPGETGCSLFVYMNDTRGDGFAELETTGETFSAYEKARSSLSLNYWVYHGMLPDLKEILLCLLNIDYNPEVC